MFQRTSRRTGGATTPASGSVTNAQLANMAAGTVKGRQKDASTGVPVDLTGSELGEILRYGTTQLVNSALPLTITLNDDTTYLVIDSSGTGTVNSISGASPGRVLIVCNTNFGTKTLVHGGGTGQFICPGLVNLQLTVREALILVGDAVLPAWQVFAVPAWLVTPAKLAAVASSLAVPFHVYVSCPSGGAAGTADDVTIWNAAAPFAMRILDAQFRVSTAVGGSSAALRTASGGGGSVVLPDPAAATQTFSTAATGVLEDLATATATVAANGSLFLRSSDRSVVGELTLTCIRT